MLSVFMWERQKCNRRKVKEAMKEKKFLTFAVVFTICLMSGCQKTEDNRRGEATKPPVEALTDAPSQEIDGTPSPGAEVTGPAQEKEESFYDLKFSFREETEEAKDGDFVYFKSTLRYPVFDGENADAMNQFVSLLMKEFREYLPEAKDNAKYDYEDSVAGEYIATIFPEEEEFIVSCLWETEQYMTLFTQCISNTGGAHPNVYCQAYVVNLTNGCPESFEQMLEPYSLTTENVVQYATEKIRFEHGEDLYDYDASHDFEKEVYRLVQDNQWYFNDKGLVLFANPYEIAAYAYGMIECEISYEELEQGLKK